MEEHIASVDDDIHHKVIASLVKVLNEWGAMHNQTHKKKFHQVLLMEMMKP